IMAFTLTACNAEEKKETKEITAVPKDEHTQSNFEDVKLKHLDLDINVNFEKRQISGVATWDIENNGKVAYLKLDTYDLEIDSVTADGKLVAHSLEKPVAHLGSVLNIPIQENTSKVSIYYASGQ